MNDETWLTSLAIYNNLVKDKDEEKGKNDNLELTGFAFSNDKLGNFLSVLSSEDLFKDVILRYSKEARNVQTNPAGETNTSLIQFQIACKMYEDIQ
jgi:Tfp pilus assembly protein PilN